MDRLSEIQKVEADLLFAEPALRDVPAYEKQGYYRCSVVFPKDGEDHIRMAKSTALEGIDWVAFDSAYNVVLFRNDFVFPDEIESVCADILTHGFFEVYLNGTKISDDLYVPAWTNYNAQDFSKLNYPIRDTFCHRSYYLRYDLTAAAKSGVNAFAVQIGDGWYGQRESKNEAVLQNHGNYESRRQRGVYLRRRRRVPSELYHTLEHVFRRRPGFSPFDRRLFHLSA